MVALFHVTSATNASRSLADGFADGHDSYLTDQIFSGVWLSDRPLDANEGAWGDTVLKITFPCDLADLTKYEWIEGGKNHREWLIPALAINVSSVQITVFDSGVSELNTLL